MRPRILILENSVAVTGAFISILRSCTALRGQFDFVFIIPSNSTIKGYIAERDFAVYELPLKEISKRFYSLIFYWPFLVVNTLRYIKLIRKLNIDLVVSNDFYNMVPCLGRIMRSKVPYVCYVRFLPSKFPPALVRVWSFLHHRYAWRMIAVSGAVESALPLKDNVTVIGNELPSTEALYESAAEGTILYLSNYIQGKGQDYAIRSFSPLAKRYPGWQIRFMGSDMGLEKNRIYKHKLKHLSATLGLEESQISWCDFDHDTVKAYQEASFVLNFSESESFSMTCLEAMFYGRPVVATRSGGPEEIIVDNITGILVNNKDTDAMTRAIEFLITHPKEREAMGQKSYVHVRQKFSYTNTVEKLGLLYLEAIKNQLDRNSFLLAKPNK